MDLTAVIVDDEQLARDELGYLLGQLEGIEVIGQAGNGVEALSAIDRLHPDVVFLDVQMPGLTGFEVARRMLDTQNGSHIIFVTAYDQHAIEAFEVNAVDYLLKPVDPSRLGLAIERAGRRVTSEPSARRAGSGWRSKLASASCSCRRRKSCTHPWWTTASPSSPACTRGRRTTG